VRRPATSATTRTLRYTSTESPIGELLLVGDERALHGLCMQAGRAPMTIAPEWRHDPAAFPDVRSQLSEYFAGQRTRFDLALEMDGTPFQRRVWDALQSIPYGQLACRIDQPTARRAVGLANGRNPVAVIVPCHRVIGADGTLTGYGGGTERKRLLLDLEQDAGTRKST